MSDREWTTHYDRGSGLLVGKLTDDKTEIHIQSDGRGKPPYFYIQVERGEDEFSFDYAYPPVAMIAELMRLHGWTCTPPKEPTG
jgi:hypothetical protein